MTPPQPILADLHRLAAGVPGTALRITGKLQVRDRIGAVVLAYESGLSRPGQPDE